MDSTEGTTRGQRDRGSSSRRYRTDGPDLPAAFAAINEDCYKTGILNDQIDRYNAVRNRVRAGKDAAAASLASHVQPSATRRQHADPDHPADRFALKSAVGNRVAALQCTLVIAPDDTRHVEALALAVDPSDESKCCVVLQLDGQHVPCQCDVSLLPHEVKRELMAPPARARLDLEDVYVDSIAVMRGSTVGWLVTLGELKGMVCDGQLLASLKSGCVRRAKGVNQAWFLLPWNFCSDGGSIHNRARVIELVGKELHLTTPARSQHNMISGSVLRCGQVARDFLLHSKRHKTIGSVLKTFASLHGSEPDLYDFSVQSSLGGETGSMQLGNIIPCEGQSNLDGTSDAFLATRCRCGFRVAHPTIGCSKDLNTELDLYHRYCQE